MALGRRLTDRPAGCNDWTLAVRVCLIVCLTVVGCAESRRDPNVGRAARAHDTPEEIHLAPRNDAFMDYAGDPNALRGLGVAIVDGRMAFRSIGITDCTKDGCPPGLLSKAAKMLQDKVIFVWDVQNVWSSQRLYLVVTSLGEESVFMDIDGQYVRLDSGAELVAINKLLKEYTFGREELNNPQSVFQFLGQITFLHRGAGLIPGSSFALKTMGRISDWLHGTADNEADLRELCEDPEFVFEGSTWTVVFNVIKRDGGVDEWTVVGELSRDSNSNEILGIDIKDILPRGTFSYAMIP